MVRERGLSELAQFGVTRAALAVVNLQAFGRAAHDAALVGLVDEQAASAGYDPLVCPTPLIAGWRVV
jgi:hypothetical protein